MRQKGVTPLLIILGVVALVVLGYLAYSKGYLNQIFGKNITQRRITPAPYPINTKPPDLTINWKSYNAPKTDNTKAFTLYYPSTWQLETQPSIKLSKGTSYFDIKQGAGSVGACLFIEDNNNPDAPKFASFFLSYKEIFKSNEITWRLAEVENPASSYDTFFLCEKKSNESFYSQYTSVGYVPVSIPQTDASTVNEALEIFEKIEIVE